MIESLLVAVPESIVSRERSDEVIKFERVTGIKNTRRFNGSMSDFIQEALKHYEGPLNFDNVIVITQTPDRFSPCMAMNVVRFLGLSSSVLAFDVNHACDGWVMGLYLANKLQGKTLLICADQLRYAPNPIEALIFSDSVTITAWEGGFNQFHSLTDTKGIEHLYLGKSGEMYMNGNEVFDFVTTTIPDFIGLFRKADYLVPHQANLSMNKLIETKAKYRGQTLYSIEEYGNMSMNSVPVTIAHNEDKCRGKNLLCVGFGAGFTAAGISIYYPIQSIARIVNV